MSKKNYYLLVIVTTITLLSVIFLVSYEKNVQVKFYTRYYITRIAEKYQLLDYNWLSADLVSIAESLNMLNKKVSDSLGQKEGELDDKSLEFPPYFAYPTHMRDVSNDIRRRVYKLTTLINAAERQKNNTLKQSSRAEILDFSTNITTNNASIKVDLPQGIEIINKKMVISNKGPEKIVNPKLIINDKKKWFNFDSIIQSIVKPHMTEEEKALSIWNFLNENRYHFYPTADRSELHNTVKYLNAYGYGLCGHTATNLYLLAEKVGLKARVWGLSGHVVSEVYFQNDWHLLDSDHEVFYLEKDNKTIASVEDLANNPELIYRLAKTKGELADKPLIGNGKIVAKIFTTKDDNYIGGNWMRSASANHNMNFVLRPGESFTAFRERKGADISHGKWYPYEPPKYGSGRFVYIPILKKNILLKNTLAQSNIKVIEENNYAVLTAEQPHQKAFIVFDFHTPYPITGANFEIDCSKTEDQDLLLVSFSEDNENWWEISMREIETTSADISIKRDFTNYFPNAYAAPLYKYFLKLEFLSTKPSSFAIKRITITTKLQLAPHSLPALEAGNNIINYLSDSPTEQAAEIELYYSLGKKYKPLMPPPKLTPPQNNKDHILFNWETAIKKDNIIKSVEYNFQLSAREDFLIPLIPTFDLITEEKIFIVDKSWLNKEQKYYWRVRSRYKDEPWGKFSKLQKFILNKLTG